MKTKVENLKGCSRAIDIEVSGQELDEKFDRVYADISKVARVPGYRPGHVPRDLLETYYAKRAEEEVIKRAIPEYYLKAVEEEQLTPVAPPEIANMQFKNRTLSFSATVDVKPQIKLKGYKGLKVVRKEITVGPGQLDQALERLRQSRAKEAKPGEKNSQEKIVPELNDDFAKGLGFENLELLREAVNKHLQVNAERESREDLERQVLEQLLKKASCDVPQSLVQRQIPELLNQLKVNRMLQGEKKEQVESKVKELEEQAQLEAARRVKLSFILEEIARREGIRENAEDLDRRIEAIAQRAGKNKAEVKRYLERQGLMPGLQEELRNKKSLEFLLKEARIEQAK